MRKVRIVETNGVKFEIAEDDGETLESLAVNLAESLSRKSYYESQASAFRTQAQNERRKAQERVTILFQLKEYNKQKRNWGPDHKVSRMEPMESYDAELIEEERKLFLQQANDFHKKSDDFIALSHKENIKISTIQNKINKMRNGSKK